jgi:hypothetical protein
VADGRMAPCSEVHLALSLFARLEALNRRIPTPPQCVRLRLRRRWEQSIC